MSLECGICERDARGGHADDCPYAEVARLRYLVEWVNDHGSFTDDEWPIWAKLQESKEPWKLAEEEGYA